MRLKSFYAKTMTEAMQMVRNTLGEDAVIVATRDERGGNVHVTAAVEPAFEIGRAGMSVGRAKEWLQYDEEDEEGQIAEELTEVMLRHNAPQEIMDHVVSCATIVGLEDPAVAMQAALEHLYTFKPLPQISMTKPIVLVGAPGSGKTLTTAKIAARGVMDGLSVGVITCDTVRAGGMEQLEVLTRLLGIKLVKAKPGDNLQSIIEDMPVHDQILIDTPGVNPFDQDSVKEIAKIIGAAQGVNCLVMPAGGDAEEAGEAARVFSMVGVDTLLPTRLDVSRRLGSLLAAAQSGSLSFSDAGNTAKVADGLMTLSPESLTRLLMPSLPLRMEKQRKTGTGH